MVKLYLHFAIHKQYPLNLILAMFQIPIENDVSQKD